MADSRLTRLERDVLDAFFRQEEGFFLSGGAALAGFHLGHRDTYDLDLFATEDSLDRGAATLAQVAEALGCSIERIQTSPDFRRHLLRRGAESVVVDLVRERVPQLVSEKPIIDGIRVDPPEEILANKLCTLLSRSELRDLVDVRPSPRPRGLTPGLSRADGLDQAADAKQAKHRLGRLAGGGEVHVQLQHPVVEARGVHEHLLDVPHGPVVRRLHISVAEIPRLGVQSKARMLDAIRLAGRM